MASLKQDFFTKNNKRIGKVIRQHSVNTHSKAKARMNAILLKGQVKSSIMQMTHAV